MNMQAELDGVKEYVRQNVPAEVFSTMEAADVKLAATGLAARALGRGQKIPAFELPDANGKLVSSASLLDKGPLVISFYRGDWCPYCNVELKALQDKLGEIEARGATLVAISPQTPDQSLSTQEKHALKFPVLSDLGNKLAREFGLVFALDESLKPIYDAFGIDLLKHNGEKTWELPVPATYVVAKDGTVANAYIDVDYRNRLAPETVLAWLDAL